MLVQVLLWKQGLHIQVDGAPVRSKGVLGWYLSLAISSLLKPKEPQQVMHYKTEGRMHTWKALFLLYISSLCNTNIQINS